MGKIRDRLGEKHDMLEVISFEGLVNENDNPSRYKIATWLCQCDCGNTCVKPSSYFARKGIYRSCGCYRESGIKRDEYCKVFGVGINDLQYKTQKEIVCKETGKRMVVWRCPYYAKWAGILERCYSEKFHEKHPTYKDCTVCEEWLTFSNFKVWMESQDWEGKELDKDLLIFGNKMYSPETCLLVPPIINAFVLDCGTTCSVKGTAEEKRGKTPKWRSRVQNPLTKKREHLGTFESAEAAHLSWLKRKLELAEELAVHFDSPYYENLLVSYIMNCEEENK